MCVATKFTNPGTTAATLKRKVRGGGKKKQQRQQKENKKNFDNLAITYEEYG